MLQSTEILTLHLFLAMQILINQPPKVVQFSKIEKKNHYFPDSPETAEVSTELTIVYYLGYETFA